MAVHYICSRDGVLSPDLSNISESVAYLAEHGWRIEINGSLVCSACVLADRPRLWEIRAIVPANEMDGCALPVAQQA